MKGTILVATAGQGILRTVDDGRTWHRLGLKEAIEFDGVVRSLAVDPATPTRVFAGADCGLCVSNDGGAHFERIAPELAGMTVWAIAIDHRNPRTIFAGTGAPSRAAMFRSTDGGASFKRLPPDIPEFCRGVNRPRILTIAIDPDDGSDVWFGIEEGGLWRSRSGGDEFERQDTPESGIASSDIHAIGIVPARGQRKKRLLVLTVNSIYLSDDDGRTWAGAASKARFDDMYYTRTVHVVDPGTEEVLVAIGDGTPGTRSKIYRSEDGGAAFSESVLDTLPNSTFWAFGSHPSDARLLFAGTKYGDLYRSTDGGCSWRKEWREFSEITAVAWTPHVAPVTAHPQSIA